MKNNKQRYFYLLLLIALVLLIAIIAILSGTISISLQDVQAIFSSSEDASYVTSSEIPLEILKEVFWTMRVPRVIMAIGIGVALAICGVVMQSSVQNPLADPFILGISSGASLGATLAIVLGIQISGFIGEMSLSLMAFIGACLATLFIFFLSMKQNGVSTLRLILAGTVINAFCAALSNGLIYVADDSEKIRSVAFWTMGSLSDVSWQQVAIVYGVLVIVLGYFLLHSKELDVMMMGNETAVTLGVNPVIKRVIMISLVAFLTSVVVSFCGVIGFVGLTVPHIVRSFVGSKHHWTLLFSAVVGALFLVGADWISRVIIPQSEMAIGIVTAIIGCPLFAGILLTNKKKL